MTDITPLPGDICACDVAGLGGKGIELGQLLSGAGKWARYAHTFMYLGDGKIIQAEPGGAVIVPLTGRRLMLWSTGRIALTDVQRRAFVAAGRALAGDPAHHRPGVGYSWLDYGALFAHTIRLPVPGLREYIAATGHMQCAQMDDFIWQQGPQPYHLFTDNRWAGYVMPWMIAKAIATA